MSLKMTSLAPDLMAAIPDGPPPQPKSNTFFPLTIDGVSNIYLKSNKNKLGHTYIIIQRYSIGKNYYLVKACPPGQ